MKKELNLQEMNEIKGGVTPEEYCGTLSMLFQNNWENWDENQRNAWSWAYVTYCIEEAVDP